MRWLCFVFGGGLFHVGERGTRRRFPFFSFFCFVFLFLLFVLHVYLHLCFVFVELKKKIRKDVSKRGKDLRKNIGIGNKDGRKEDAEKREELEIKGMMGLVWLIVWCWFIK